MFIFSINSETYTFVAPRRTERYTIQNAIKIYERNLNTKYFRNPKIIPFSNIWTLLISSVLIYCPTNGKRTSGDVIKCSSCGSLSLLILPRLMRLLIKRTLPSWTLVPSRLHVNSSNLNKYPSGCIQLIKRD